MGRYRYTIVGEVDRFGTWRSDLKKRIAAQQDLKLPLQTGAGLLEQVRARAAKKTAQNSAWAQVLRPGSGDRQQFELALQTNSRRR